MASNGDKLGLYRIIRHLGRGGMGEVCEVEHEVLLKRYALKLLPEDFAERPGALERFKREARAMAALDHPNIVKVDEFGETPSTGSGEAARYWLRMELAEGIPKTEVGGRKSDQRIRTLAEYVESKGDRLEPDEAEVIFTQILEGLAHAHKHGVVHRDLKPENILLFGAGEDERPTSNVQHPTSKKTRNPEPGTSKPSMTAKISDFGLVLMVGEEWVRSQADLSIRLSMSLGQMNTEVGSADQAGTYEYMSPEQKRGEEATAASDVYAVGLMMYRLLTGRTQLGRKGISDIVADAPDWWDELVDKGVEDDAGLRFADAGKMLTVFQAMHKTPGKASQPSPEDMRGLNRDAVVNPEHQRFVPDAEAAPDFQELERAENAVLTDELTSPANQQSVSPPPVKRNSWRGIVIGLVVAALIGVAAQQLISNVLGSGSDDRGPVPGQNWKSPSTGMEFVWIKAMNCWVGKYEVTNGEYRKKEPSHDSKEYKGHSLNGARQPVVYVNFDDAKAYAAWLTDKDKAVLGGASYRLPTNDEFMTFAQCGDGREYPWGNNWPPRSGQAGNYHGQEGAGIWSKIDGYRDGHPVTCNVEDSWANSWDLYGVGGNVWECASKSPAGSFGAWRGASWRNHISGLSALLVPEPLRRIGSVQLRRVSCIVVSLRAELVF